MLTGTFFVLGDDVEDWVNSPAFNFSCAQKAHELARALKLYDSNFSDEANSLWSSSDSVTSATTVKSNPHEVVQARGALLLRWPRT